MATSQIWMYPQGVQAGRDLTGYDVEARDGSIGSIDQSTQDVDEYWVIVDTGPWIFGKRVLIPAGLIERVDDNEERVFVDRTRDEIKNAPEYDITVGASGPYRQELGSYYATPPAVRVQQTRVPPPSGRRTQGTRQSSRSRASSSRSRSSSSSRSKSGSSSRSRRGTSSRSRTSDEPTRDELYEQAKRLDIPGRSKMAKAQLKQAISRRRGRTSSASSRSGSRASSGRSRSSSSTRSRSGRRTSSSKAHPVEVQKFLEGVSYPTERGDLIRQAERRGASNQVRKTLERLPAERFESPTDVSEAIGNLRR